MVIVFDILLVSVCALIAWFSLYVLYRTFWSK